MTNQDGNKMYAGIINGYSGEIIEIETSGKYKNKEEVIFKDEDGEEEYGIIKYLNLQKNKDKKQIKNSKILRRPTASDVQKIDAKIQEAKEGLETCKKLAKSLNLKINLFRAGYSFNNRKAFFSFTSEERVDFRELVKQLARSLKKQIHLRQVGPRDKAKLIGGYGKCGRELCCSSWLDKLESINMEMVRVQGLENKGSSKLSGVCGKLLCCLKYEVSAYKDLRKSLPKIGTRVKFKDDKDNKNEGKVIGLDVLNQKLKITNESGEYFHIPKEQLV